MLFAGDDNILRTEDFLEINHHTGEITDCIEILNPLCIATCSLDKTIVMYDLDSRQILRKIQEHHKKGIRHLRYQAINGAHMVSLGTETHANVWAPESLVSKIHLGKFVGKSSLIDG